jgi:hypothetical protein
VTVPVNEQPLLVPLKAPLEFTVTVEAEPSRKFPDQEPVTALIEAGVLKLKDDAGSPAAVNVELVPLSVIVPLKLVPATKLALRDPEKVWPV